MLINVDAGAPRGIGPLSEDARVYAESRSVLDADRHRRDSGARSGVDANARWRSIQFLWAPAGGTWVGEEQ